MTKKPYTSRDPIHPDVNVKRAEQHMRKNTNDATQQWYDDQKTPETKRLRMQRLLAHAKRIAKELAQGADRDSAG